MGATRRLKVFSWSSPWGPRVVATTTKKEAARLCGASLYDFARFGHEVPTGDAGAPWHARPGVVFHRLKERGPWVPLKPPVEETP